MREVTVIFADLSGFAALSGRVSAEVLTRVTNEYLAYIVEAVESTGGYVDKFIGDAVMAMWGAPEPQADQAARAVRAGLAMHASLPALNERWLAVLGEPMQIGVGINSGASNNVIGYSAKGGNDSGQSSTLTLYVSCYKA